MTPAAPTRSNTAPEPEAATETRRSSSSSRRSPQKVWAVRGLAAAAAAAASLLSDAEPTGILAADVLWRAGAAAGFTLLTSRATRASWLWMTAVATVAVVGSWSFAVAVPALALATYTTRLPHRPRVLGGVIGALASLALLTLPDLGPHGTSSLVVVAAVVPVIVAAYRRSRRRVRRQMRRGTLWAALALVLVGGVAGVTVGSSRVDLQACKLEYSIVSPK